MTAVTPPRCCMTGELHLAAWPLPASAPVPSLSRPHAANHSD
jgi:hypothetical protein